MNGDVIQHHFLGYGSKLEQACISPETFDKVLLGVAHATHGLHGAFNGVCGSLTSNELGNVRLRTVWQSFIAKPSRLRCRMPKADDDATIQLVTPEPQNGMARKAGFFSHSRGVIITSPCQRPKLKLCRKIVPIAKMPIDTFLESNVYGHVQWNQFIYRVFFHKLLFGHTFKVAIPPNLDAASLGAHLRSHPPFIFASYPVIAFSGFRNSLDRAMGLSFVDGRRVAFEARRSS